MTSYFAQKPLTKLLQNLIKQTRLEDTFKLVGTTIDPVDDKDFLDNLKESGSQNSSVSSTNSASKL